jgi:hypothetical protein
LNHFIAALFQEAEEGENKLRGESQRRREGRIGRKERR